MSNAGQVGQPTSTQFVLCSTGEETLRHLLNPTETVTIGREPEKCQIVLESNKYPRADGVTKKL